MKKIIYSIFLFVILISISYSQPTLQWRRYVGNGGPNFHNWEHRVLSADGEGNTYVIGQNDDLPAGVYVMSYDAFGNVRFCDTVLIGTAFISGQAIDSQYNSYLFAGSILQKYSSNGSFMWQSTVPWSTDWSRVIATQQNAYVLFGISDPRSIYKFADNGTLLDSLDVPFQSSYSYGILNGDYILGGKVNGSPTDSLLVTRTTTSGAQVWRTAFLPSGGVSSSPAGIFVTPSGNIYIFVHGYLGLIAIVAKLNSNGNVLWVNSYYVDPGVGYIGTWAVDNAENVYVTTTTCMFKYNSSGVFQWADPHSQRVICLDGNNDLLVSTSPSNDTLRTSKFSPSGTKLWSVDYHFPYSTINNYPRGIATDNNFNIYVGATFDSGSICGLVLKYGNAFSVSGQIRFQDNNQPVSSGFVKAVLYDSTFKQVITVDSTGIQPNGNYSLVHIPSGISTDIMAFENDESQLMFVPTYYPSTIYYDSATTLTVNGNLTNINIGVFRINNSGGPYHIAGTVNRNVSLPLVGLKDAIVYAKLGNNYQAYSVSNSSGYYRVDSLSSGTYNLIVDRMGFPPANRQVVLTNFSKDTINFTLDNGGLLGTSNETGDVPKQYYLNTNYPNPFNPVTQINFGLPKSSHVTITIYDITGKEVAKLVNEVLNAGKYTKQWNAENYSSGVYFYRLESGDFIQTRKMVLIK